MTGEISLEQPTRTAEPTPSTSLVPGSFEAIMERLQTLDRQGTLLLAAALRDHHFNPRPALAVLREARAMIETLARVAGHLPDTPEPPVHRPDIDELIMERLRHDIGALAGEPGALPTDTG
jgi:hypothetical protein